MKIEQIIYFAKIAQTQSITTAAELLHISQPAISVAISDLEFELGVKLFSRSRSGTILTEQGANLLPEAEKILHAWENLKSRANQESSSICGNLIMSCVPSLGFTFLPRLISRFKKDFPRIDIKLYSDGTKQIMKDISNGKSQIGFVSTAFNYQLPSSVFHLESLFQTAVTAVANTEIVARLDSTRITLTQLANFPLLTFTSEYTAYTDLNEKMQMMCNKGSITFMESYETLIQLCLSGVGIGFLPDVVAKKNIHVMENRLTMLDIQDLDVKRQIYLICQKNLPFSNPLRKFIAFAHELSKEYKR